MFLSDLHMHTWLSIDGSESVGALCEAALRQGLGAIALTDHWDGFPPGVRDAGFAPHFMDSRDFWALHGEKLLPKIEEARERYAGRLRILYGVDLGQPQLDPVQTRAFLDAHRFDFVLASEHLNGDSKDYYTLDYTQVDIDALMRECFELELAVVRSGTADAIAHIDQPVRLMRGMAFDIGLTAYREQIAELLREMAARALHSRSTRTACATGTAASRRRSGCSPLFRDLGGELVTTGSDAHRASDVGAGIREAKALAEACGLRVVSYFSQHEPVIFD